MSRPVAPGRLRSPLPPPQPSPRPAKKMTQVDRSRVNPQLVKAAEGMESMFLDYMMQVMRKTVPKSELSNDNAATKIYQGMMDSEVAKTASRQGGVGLADQIIAYMAPESYNLRTRQGKNPQASHPGREVQSPRRTGGTHEGQSNSD